jgi:2'-5' RNA ligase
MDGIALNIALLPDKSTVQRVMDISQQLSGHYPTRFVLNPQTALPHITLYQVYLPAHNLDILRNQLPRLGRIHLPIEIRTDCFEIQFQTLIYWTCIITPALQQLHDDTVDIVNSLREGLVLPDLASLPGMSPVDQNEYHTFGSLFVKKRFHPHITVCRLSQGADAASALGTLSPKTVTFTTTILILGHLGDSGTVSSVIESFGS